MVEGRKNMYSQDKRDAIRQLLSDPDIARKSTKAIHIATGYSWFLIRDVRAELTGDNVSHVIGSDGKKHPGQRRPCRLPQVQSRSPLSWMLFAVATDHMGYVIPG